MQSESNHRSATRNPTIYALVDYYGGDYQMSLLQATEPHAHKLGYDLITLIGRAVGAPIPADAVQNEIYRFVDMQRASGILIGSGCMGIYVSPEVLGKFCERYRPLPIVSASVQLPGIPSLIVSNFSGMKLAVDHLIETHQCRRIAHVRGPVASEEAEDRYLGYRASLEEHGIEYDPTLVEVGNFWINSGEQAARSLLSKPGQLDAIVTANDYMAVGVMDVLRAEGIRVPHAMRVVGFDDAPTARFTSPSLTTVRQPLAGMGRLAVETIHRIVSGEPVDQTQLLEVELILRQSCGCGYRVSQSMWPAARLEEVRPTALALLGNRVSLEQALVSATELDPSILGGWAKRITLALTQQLHGQDGRFLLELEDILDEVQPDTNRIERFYAVVEALRYHFRNASTEGCSVSNLDDIWHGALLLVGDAARRSHLRDRYDANSAIDLIRSSVERLSTSLSQSALVDALRGVFELTKVASASLSLYTDDSRSQLKNLLVHGRNVSQTALSQPFPSEQLAPSEFFSSGTPKSYVALPVNYGIEHLGIVVLEAGAHHSIYTSLREHIGAALKGAALHRSVVQETALRERAERAQLEKESLIAQQIQTAILPSRTEVTGLELHASMKPATSVGGDYYEIIPTADGCWLGIGDVAGHGLMAGMIMLMIQSMVRATIAVNPNAEPRDLVVGINQAIYDNLRYRLGRDDYATFCLIHFRTDGMMSFAGTHEELIVCRAATGKCVRVATPGMWLGAIEDVAELTSNSQLKLEPGDFLVLFTDGITEPLNLKHEQFGVERLCQIIEAHSHQSARAMGEAIEAAVHAWTATQIDDATVLVARYTGRD